MSSRSVVAALVATLTSGGVAACGVGRAAASSPIEAALERSRSTIDDALEAAHEAEQTQDIVAFSARYNPAPCDCPAWEIVLTGRWQRVYVEVEAEHELALEALTEQAARDAQTQLDAFYTARGRLSRSTRVSEDTRMRYHTLFLVDLTRAAE